MPTIQPPTWPTDIGLEQLRRADAEDALRRQHEAQAEYINRTRAQQQAEEQLRMSGRITPQFNIRIDRGFIPFEINHQKLNVSLEPTQRGVRMSLLSTRGTNRRVIIQLFDHHGQVLHRVPQDGHFHYGIQMVDRDGYLRIPEVKERS